MHTPELNVYPTEYIVVMTLMNKGGEGERVFDAVIADFCAAEGGEIGTGAEGFSDVFGEGADVGARAAVNADFE